MGGIVSAIIIPTLIGILAAPYFVGGKCLEFYNNIEKNAHRMSWIETRENCPNAGERTTIYHNFD